jgi:hypothetical protein
MKMVKPELKMKPSIGKTQGAGAALQRSADHRVAAGNQLEAETWSWQLS